MKKEVTVTLKLYSGIERGFTHENDQIEKTAIGRRELADRDVGLGAGARRQLAAAAGH